MHRAGGIRSSGCQSQDSNRFGDLSLIESREISHDSAETFFIFHQAALALQQVKIYPHSCWPHQVRSRTTSDTSFS